MIRREAGAALSLSLIVVMCLASSARAKSSGDATISYQYGNSPGVLAKATSYSPPTSSSSSSPQTSFPLANETQSTSQASESFTYGPTEAPERDEFSAGYLTIPNPCVRRKFGGDYCEATAPVPPVRDNGPRDQPREQGPPPPSPEQIARTAIDRAVSLAPNPQLEVAPGRVGMTGLESYFWLADPPTTISASAGVPGLTVVARAVPSQFVWSFGDGEDLVTSTAGARWSPQSRGGIAHMYETKGTYELSVEVVWEASYSVNGGTWTAIGAFTTSDARAYPVREMVAVLVPD